MIVDIHLEEIHFGGFHIIQVMDLTEEDAEEVPENILFEGHPMNTVVEEDILTKEEDTEVGGIEYYTFPLVE
jgi:hypothetical protein